MIMLGMRVEMEGRYCPFVTRGKIESLTPDHRIVAAIR